MNAMAADAPALFLKLFLAEIIFITARTILHYVVSTIKSLNLKFSYVSLTCTVFVWVYVLPQTY